jgi:hypothetical protein
LIVPLLLGFTSLVAGENCPSPADVEQRVRTILHLSPEQDLNERFSVERHEAGLYVALQNADATPIGQRTLPAEGSCDELAQAAAVVLSTWLSDVHPDFAGALPEPPRPAPELSAPPAAASLAAPAPAPAAPPPRAAGERPATKSSLPSHRPQLALALGASAAASKWAAAGLLSVGWLPRASGVGVSAVALMDASRREPLGSGGVEWRRWPLAVGPSLRLDTRPLAWELSLAPALAWVHVAGEGFDRNLAENGWALGGFGQLQVSSRGRHWALVGAVNGQFYLGNSDAYVGQLSYRLPSATLGVFLGARWSP